MIIDFLLNALGKKVMSVTVSQFAVNTKQFNQTKNLQIIHQK